MEFWWKKWIAVFFHEKNNNFDNILCVSVDIVNTDGECIAFEVLKYREKREKGAFASSTRPRTNRSKPEIKYRIGQVIKHKRWGYRAVIVGWDQQANAPEEWIKQV